MKNYRRADKRRAYKEYVAGSESLKQQLKSGRISQEQFEQEHDALDYKFNWVR